MLAQAVSEGTKRSKEKNAVEVQKGNVNEKRMQEELFGRRRNGAKKMRKHRNDECKYEISKTQTLQLRRQRTRKGAPCDRATCQESGGRPLASLFLVQRTSCRQSPRGYDTPAKKRTSCQKLIKCQDQIEQGNVPSAIWKMPRGWRGRDLSIFAKANVPPLGVDQSQSQSQRQGQTQQIDRTRHRQDEALPVEGRRQYKMLMALRV